jgi:hypothetical protein
MELRNVGKTEARDLDHGSVKNKKSDFRGLMK